MVKRKSKPPAKPANKKAQPADAEWNLSPQLTFRMSEDLRAELEAYCRRHDVQPSDVARQALAELLGKPKLAKIGSRGRRWPKE